MAVYWREDALVRGGYKLADLLALTNGASDTDEVVARWREALQRRPVRTEVLYTATEIKRVLERHPHLFSKPT